MDKELYSRTSEACKLVTDRFGREILRDKKRFCAAFSDFAPKLSKENKAFYLALSENIGDIFLREDEAVRSGEKTPETVLRRAETELNDYLNAEKSELVVKSIAYALGWKIKVTEEKPQTAETPDFSDNSSVIEELFKKAQNGDNDACFNLGERFYYGRGVKQDYEKAVYWYTQSSDRGDCSSQKKLAECYRLGQGVRKNDALAAKRYSQAAEQGDYDSQKALIALYHHGGSGLPADTDIANKLSARYGIPLDMNEFEVLTAKAENGNPDAQLQLGNMYWTGRETPVNHKKAAEWYKKAALQGEPNAMYNLACCYSDGDGVPKDSRKAADLFAKAAAQGDNDALNNLAECYSLGKGVTPSATKAASLYRQAADAGHALAQFNLGECFFHGWGEGKNYEKAVIWYKRAALQGVAEAQYSYGWCCFNGLGIPKDLYEAKKMFDSAAANDYNPARKMLGYCYMNGLGTAPNLGTAADYFEKSYNRGDEESGKMLAVCLKYGGDYLQKNEIRAKNIADKCGFDYDSI